MYALIFDVDGVLADTEPLSQAAANDVFLEMYNVALPPDAHLPYMGATDRRHMEGLARTHGVEIDLGRTIAAHDSRFLAKLAHAGDISIRGAGRLVDDMASRPGWRLALATSSRRDRSAASLHAARIPVERFAAWLTGDDIGNPKPDPEIYLKASAALEVPPARCVVIEDSVAGVAAARAAGMGCIAVTHTFPREALTEANRIMRRIDDVTFNQIEELLHT